MKVATKQVWLTKDKQPVDEDDPTAAFLFAAKGDELPDDEVDAIEGADAMFADIKTVPARVPIVPFVRPDIAEPGFSNEAGARQAPGANVAKEGPVKRMGSREDVLESEEKDKNVNTSGKVMKGKADEDSREDTKAKGKAKEKTR